MTFSLRGSQEVPDEEVGPSPSRGDAEDLDDHILSEDAKNGEESDPDDDLEVLKEKWNLDQENCGSGGEKGRKKNVFVSMSSPLSPHADSTGADQDTKREVSAKGESAAL